MSVFGKQLLLTHVLFTAHCPVHQLLILPPWFTYSFCQSLQRKHFFSLLLANILVQWRFLTMAWPKRRRMRSIRRCCTSRCCCTINSRCLCTDRSLIQRRKSPLSAPISAPLRVSTTSICTLVYLKSNNATPLYL